MSLASQIAAPHVAAPMVETNITSMSETGLIVLSVCAVVLAGALLIPVMLAGRAPRRTGPASTPPWTGPVQGGVHLGDGRSVAPHRDAPAEESGREKVVQGQAAGDEGAGAEEG
jgi:hypothetical protein